MSQWRLRQGLAVAIDHLPRPVPTRKKEPSALVHAHAAVTPPSATHMSATASRRPGFRVAEPPAHGRRLPSRWRTARRRTGRGRAARSGLLQLLLELATGKSHQFQAPVVESQMNGLVLGVHNSSHVEFQRKHIGRGEEFGIPKAT